MLLGAIFLGVRLGGYRYRLRRRFKCTCPGTSWHETGFDSLGCDPDHRVCDCGYFRDAVGRWSDYLVQIAERILRSNPKNINYLALTVTYVDNLSPVLTAFLMIPVIVEVAKEHIKPVVPLSIAVVASQIAITASPVSAAVTAMSGGSGTARLELPGPCSVFG